MKKIVFLSLAFASVMFTLSSCDKDEADNLVSSADKEFARSYVDDKYPGARIVDIDNEHGRIEVEFVYDGLKYETLLTMEHEWIYTKVDYDRNLSVLPEGVTLHIEREYPSYIIEDIEYYESTKGSVYEVEIENKSTDHDMELYFDAVGTLVTPSFKK